MTDRSIPARAGEPRRKPSARPLSTLLSASRLRRSGSGNANYSAYILKTHLVEKTLLTESYGKASSKEALTTRFHNRFPHLVRPIS